MYVPINRFLNLFNRCFLYFLLKKKLRISLRISNLSIPKILTLVVVVENNINMID